MPAVVYEKRAMWNSIEHRRSNYKQNRITVDQLELDTDRSQNNSSNINLEHEQRCTHAVTRTRGPRGEVGLHTPHPAPAPLALTRTDSAAQDAPGGSSSSSNSGGSNPSSRGGGGGSSSSRRASPGPRPAALSAEQQALHDAEDELIALWSCVEGDRLAVLVSDGAGVVGGWGEW